MAGSLHVITLSFDDGFDQSWRRAALERAIDELLGGPPGWLVYNLRGLDGEGWGPVRRDGLAFTRDRLRDSAVTALPLGAALVMADARPSMKA